MSDKIGRNDPCPCGSGKKYKKCCMSMHAVESPTTWVDADGLHIKHKGEKPTNAELEQMTKTYQEQIRLSPLWDKMVEEFGEEKAGELLKGFTAQA